MTVGHPPRYSVQILLPRVVQLDAIAIDARLKAWRHDVELLSMSADRAVYAIPTDDLPLLVYLFRAAPDAYAAPLNDALSWSTWHERWDQTQARCRASIVVTITAQRAINHAAMLLAFLAVLDTVLFWLDDADRDVAVLHWMPAQQLLTFERYRRLRTELGPCGPAVNVRIANATGRPGELLADTVGLAELGLPDLQTVFSNRDPAEVELQLRRLVSSMFVGDRLDCASWVEEASLVPPMRDALTLQLD